MVADIFHHGHVAFLRTARSLGDRLVVYVLDDNFVTGIKGPPVMSQQERISVVEACRYVDEVLTTGPQKITPQFMQDQGYSIYAMGYANEREHRAKKKNCSELPDAMVAVIPYTHDISSTLIRERLRARDA